MALLVMVAGPNGSGKSTLIGALRSDPVIGLSLPAIYVNADDIQRETRLDAAGAQRAATELRARALAERRDVMYETVMSHPSKLGELQQARAAGYEVHVFFLATEDASINVQRVALRVAAGGHDVPEDRTRQRYERTLALAPAALSLADRAFAYDNSNGSAGIQLQAQLVGDRLEWMTAAPARWVESLVSRVNERADELQGLRDRARASGETPVHAGLCAGETEGPFETMGTHYLAQRDLKSGALVVHDRVLLTGVRPVQQGASHRVKYLEGVGTEIACHYPFVAPLARTPARPE